MDAERERGREQTARGFSDGGMMYDATAGACRVLYDLGVGALPCSPRHACACALCLVRAVRVFGFVCAWAEWFE